mmetsp:Transcript_4583/g.11345  ORF Transcript_4583/g.11345 Transcript_4583/m.11345 type:complete len:477 (-) Transcript_4583:2343-3773(-)
MREHHLHVLLYGREALASQTHEKVANEEFAVVNTLVVRTFDRGTTTPLDAPRTLAHPCSHTLLQAEANLVVFAAGEHGDLLPRRYRCRTLKVLERLSVVVLLVHISHFYRQWRGGLRRSGGGGGISGGLVVAALGGCNPKRLVDELGARLSTNTPGNIRVVSKAITAEAEDKPFASSTECKRRYEPVICPIVSRRRYHSSLCNSPACARVARCEESTFVHRDAILISWCCWCRHRRVLVCGAAGIRTENHTADADAGRSRRQARLLVKMQIKPEHDAIHVPRSDHLKLQHRLTHASAAHTPASIEEELEHLLRLSELAMWHIFQVNSLRIAVPAVLVEGRELLAIDAVCHRLDTHDIHRSSHGHVRRVGLHDVPLHGLHHVQSLVSDQRCVEEVHDDEIRASAPHFLTTLREREVAHADGDLVAQPVRRHVAPRNSRKALVQLDSHDAVCAAPRRHHPEQPGAASGVQNVHLALLA